jgi:hypothetical protein
MVEKNEKETRIGVHGYNNINGIYRDRILIYLIKFCTIAGQKYRRNAMPCLKSVHYIVIIITVLTNYRFSTILPNFLYFI